jgi:membrane fusion protein, multidrug efflux system
MVQETSSRISVCGIGLLVVLAGISGCSPEKEPTPAIPPVQTFVIATTSEAPFRRFPGEVAAADTSNMSFDVPGRLIEFPASQEGMVVKKGDLLGRLDETNFVARVDAARADFTNAKSELARRQQLLNQGAISRSEFESFERTFGVADAALRSAQRALDDTRLVAPMDGRIARRLVNNFQNVQAHQPVLVFQSKSTLEVDIHVPEADMSMAGRGVTTEELQDLIEAKVEFPAIPGRTFPLNLNSFSTEATASARTFRVSFILYPPEGQNILPGMTCTVLLRQISKTVAEPAETGVFQIPVRAVATADGKSAVWKLDPKSLQVSRVEVELLGMTGDSVKVRGANLATGDEIVTAGVRFLSDGMKVQRLPAGNP